MMTDSKELLANYASSGSESAFRESMGFIVLPDPANENVLRFSCITCRHVDRIEVGGGYVGAQFDRHLFRAPLKPQLWPI